MIEPQVVFTKSQPTLLPASGETDTDASSFRSGEKCVLIKTECVLLYIV